MLQQCSSDVLTSDFIHVINLEKYLWSIRQELRKLIKKKNK